MFALLFDPIGEIREAKKQSFAKILLYLLTAAMFWTIGVLFFAWRYFADWVASDFLVLGILGSLFGTMLFAVVMAFFFAVSYHVLDGKAGYYEALALVVLSMVAPAVAWFFAGALSFVPYGIVVSALLIAYGHVLSGATGARAAKEYFGLDYAGVFLGAVIAKAPLIALLAVAILL